MFTLFTDRSKYFRVKRGQNACEIERVLKSPVHGNVFAGRIIELGDKNLKQYVVSVGETYHTIALKFQADEELLKKTNGYKPVYPTCKLFVPCD